jgi:hypothetical protein
MRGRKDQVGQGRLAPDIFSNTGSTEGTNPDLSTPKAGGEGGGCAPFPELHYPLSIFSTAGRGTEVRFFSFQTRID